MSSQEPLAIVGIGCRFPGASDSPQAFWELLRNGRDAVTEVPPSRWNAARFYHPNSAAPGRMVTRWGGFVERPDEIDAAFFGMAPREAARLDPQHRWLAEVTWEAIEDAGLAPERLAESRTGVYIGISSSDYPTLHRMDIHAIDGYANIGSALCIAANRLSFLLNLRGPSLAVDTACSSSMVALHLAAQSLRAGECDYAVVGGANSLLSPESSLGFSQAHMLSPRGRCRAFDAEGDGYVRAEGAAALLIMPLHSARELGLHPRALLLATASNQDGRSSSLTVPNQAAQEAMVREALRTAGVDPGEVVYVEAHGTGTPVGDPIEARALAAVLAGEGRRERLLIGSVKTNIGHLESASGLAGLIKAVLVLEQRAIPANLHFATPHPQLPKDRLAVPTTLTPLPIGSGPAPLVAVNSFGFGGTNAHALLAPAEAAAPEPKIADATEPCLFPLSARSPAALAAYAEAYAGAIDPEKETFTLRELSAAAALGKSHHPYRQGVVASSLGHLREQLLALGEKAFATTPVGARPKVAFVFCGQGPQWWAMGRQLFERDPIVREMWERCDAACRKVGGPDLLEALLASEADSPLARTDYTQPALFALQASLVERWRAWGIEADAVIGHSVGEAAAAWAAGIFDLEGIFRLILARSAWQAKTHGLGRMLAAGISAEEAERLVKRFAGRIALAALNAPNQITLSGEGGALEEIATALQLDGKFCRLLSTPYAFHSAQMDVIETGMRQALIGTAGAPARLPMISTMTGRPVRGTELDAEYWWRNVRQPVRFATGIERLLRDGCTLFVEIGPHPVMASAIAEIAQSRKSSAVSIASLRRGDDELTTIQQALGALYRHGAPVRWEALYSRPSRAIRLPAYPWQRQRLWHESAEVDRLLRSAPPHPLLGDRQPHPQPTWMNRLDTRVVTWLADHRLTGSAVLPAAAYVEMAAAAVREYLGSATVLLEDIRFHRMLFLPEGHPVPTCVRLNPAAGTFEVLAAPPENPSAWELYAEGLFRNGRLRMPAALNLDDLHARIGEERSPEALYRELSQIGQVFGPAFQGVTALWINGTEALGQIATRVELDSPDYLLFPPSFDSCFHPSAALERQARSDSRAVVTAVRRLRLFAPLAPEIWSHLRIVNRNTTSYLADLSILDSAGAILAEVEGLAVRTIDAERGLPQRTRKVYQMQWESAPAQSAGNAPGSEVAIFCDSDGRGEALGAALRALETPVTLIFADAGRRQRNGNSLNVNLREKNWAAGLWETLHARGAMPARFVYLWSRDANDASYASHGCATLLALLQARLTSAKSDTPARWLVITARAQCVRAGEPVAPMGAAIWGLARTAQTEHPEWQLSLIDCDDAAVTQPCLYELQTETIEPEVAWRGDERWVRRMHQLEISAPEAGNPPPAFVLEVGQTGQTDSLHFQGRARIVPAADEVEIQIAAAGLNFRDLMKVLGIYPLREGEKAVLGDEFSGRVVRIGAAVRKFAVGDLVMGFAPIGGAFASHLKVPADAIWKMPEGLSFADAASIPVVFGTAFHALKSLARLRRGETILIHAAAGGVGLAAVQLAQRIGARVLATAGSEEKRALLREMGVAHVMDSRTLDFAEETRQFTSGRGVDVVLNSLAGSFQQESLGVCAPHGRFIEIGKRDLFENRPLPQSVFQRSLAFFAFDLPSVMASGGAHRKALVKFFEAFSRGEFRPVPVNAFTAGDAISAFRLMQGAQHVGKIVLEFDAAQPPDIHAEFWPDAEGTYLVTGGLSGFGLATAQWLAARGARHLALLSRRGTPSEAVEPVLAELRRQQVTVITLAADVADSQSLASALRQLEKLSPPLRGVFHSAMVLRDATFAQMTREELEEVLAPKIAGAWNLHEQTRTLSLDCFVMFSSVSALLGAPGQANYAAANAFLDALAEHRRGHSLPALSVNWGQISDVGIVAERPEIGRYLDTIGVGALPARKALAALPSLIASGQAQAGVMEIEWHKLVHLSDKFASSPIFRKLIEAGSESRAHDHRAGEWRESILSLHPDEQISAVSDVMVAQLAATLGMPAADLDPARPLTELGMDSLMAVELKARIEGHTGTELPFNLFSADLSAELLAKRFLKQLTTPTAAAPAPARRSSTSDEASLLRIETTPLPELIRSRELAPLVAGALMPWPAVLLEQLPISPTAFIQHMSGGRVSLDLIVETPFGSVGIFMLPLPAAQVTPRESTLLPVVLEGIAAASTCGATCVALTGLIPSATGYGQAVQDACDERGDLASPTTGHATTIAAVVLNLEALLRTADRAMEDEIVMFYGIGSIGLGALRLMLDVLPHPAELRLCDPYRSAESFDDLERTLRREHKFEGEIRIVRPEQEIDLYDASVIVGATNVENVIEVTRLAPGTLVVDDSWPHCLNGPAALDRLTVQRDILITEGGFVRSPAPMSRITRIPAALAGIVPADLPNLLFSSLNAHDITACVLSAVLTAHRPELAPTIGLVDLETTRQHWEILHELGFAAADPSYEGVALDRDDIEAFRERFGKRGRTSANPAVASTP